MLFKWLPWKYLVRRVARHHGFLDPILILSRLGKFAQPSEVGEPIELLRAGLVFHARGLMNTRAIQNNLDWIWPYWVERQFNPRDSSFIPRAFSISHINLSHRNWTCVGLPDSPYLPIVDPSGLVTPYYDGWSLDAWIQPRDGNPLLPSKSKTMIQSLELDGSGEAGVTVETRFAEPGIRMETRVEAHPGGNAGLCWMRVEAKSDSGGWLAISLRPYNPEGVSFIHDIRLEPDRKRWVVDGFPAITFSEPAELHFSSEYHLGDVFHKLDGQDGPVGLHGEEGQRGQLGKTDLGSHCKVGLATAAALFRIKPGVRKVIEITVDLAGDRETPKQFPVRRAPQPWAPALAGLAQLETPDPHFDFLYRAAIRTLILHSPDEVFPGPYTYKRFWFRDAAIILNAMLATGMGKRVERTLDLFPAKQTLSGIPMAKPCGFSSAGAR
jgi:hypothetical protein